MPHGSDKLHFWRVIWIIVWEAQYRLEKPSLNLLEASLTSYNVSLGPSKIMHHLKRSFESSNPMEAPSSSASWISGKKSNSFFEGEEEAYL